MIKSNKLLGGSALLLLCWLHTLSAEPVIRLRWGLDNEREFFHEVISEAPNSPRRFGLDVEKAKQEGVEQCANNAKAGKPRTDFCEALSGRIAPVFDFAFDSAQPGVFILDTIEVECYEFGTNKGIGFSKDLARYDLLLPTKVGVVTRVPTEKLIFTGAGTAQLRLWPDVQERNGVRLDLSIHFLFRNGAATYTASTGRFTLKF
jgi:hypothetical protein